MLRDNKYYPWATSCFKFLLILATSLKQISTSSFNVLPIKAAWVGLAVTALILNTVFANSKPENQPYTHPRFDRVDSLMIANDTGGTINYLHHAIEEFRKEEDYKGQIMSICKLAGLKIGLQELDEAEELLINAELLIEERKADQEILAEWYFRKGILSEYLIKIDSALLYHDLSLQLRKSYFGETSVSVARSYNEIANIYRYRLLNFYAAEEKYLQAYEIWGRLDSKHKNYYLGNICYNLSSTYKLKGDNEKALTFANQARLFYEESDEEDYMYIAFCEALLASIYLGFDYTNAIHHYRKATEYLQHVPYYSDIYMPNFLSGLAEAYYKTQNLDSSLYYIDKAIAVSEKTKTDHIQLAKSYEVKGMIYSGVNKELALYYYNDALNILKNQLPNNHPSIATLYVNIAETFVNSGNNYELGLEHISTALDIYGVNDFVENKLNKNIWDADVEGILHALYLYGNTNFKLFEKTQDIRYLSISIRHFSDFDKIFERFRMTLNGESSRIDMAKKYKDVYEEAVKAAFALYQIQPSDSLAGAIVGFMERNKSLALFDVLRETQIQAILNIPPSLKAEENNIESLLYFYSLELAGTTERDMQDQLYRQIYDLKLRLDSVKHEFHKNFPEYYTLKYENATFSFDQLKTQLKEFNSILIEAFYGKDNIYLILIDPLCDQVKLNKVANDAHIENLFLAFYENLNNEVDIHNIEGNYYQYLYSSYGLFQEFLSPFFEDRLHSPTDENIIFVPDGFFSFVPIEALVYRYPIYNKVNFKNLDYLVNKYAVNYYFSSSIFLLDSDSKKSSGLDNNHQVLLFNYGNDELVNRDPNYRLSGAYRESRYIAGLTSAKIFSSTHATKSNFLKNLSGANIIHLALHGYTDADNLNNPAIRFYQEEGNPDNQYLFYHELLGVDIKARLAVLSACETAFGELKSGEGVFHLARGFRYAGCPSLIGSLWKISDNSTALIMEELYKNMSEHQPLPKALQHAKLAFLENGDEISSHPRFWSSMILIGNGEPVNFEPSSKSVFPYLLSILLTLLVLFAIYKKVFR